MAYSEAKIADVLARLAMNEGNIAKTARETGIDRGTIRRWDKLNIPGGDIESVGEKFTQKKDTLADLLEAIAFKVLTETLDAEAINYGGFSQRMTGAGIAIDKMRALRGQGHDAQRGLDKFLEDTEFEDVE